MAESSELITEEEIKDRFAHSNKYGETKPAWLKRTILLYKSTDEWKRIDNDIPPKPKHAEVKMCESLMAERQANSSHEKIEVILSYSPCPVCCEELIKLKEMLGSQLKITFSNFHKSYNVNYLLCLSTLLDKDIELEVFKGLNEWKYMLEAAKFDFRISGREIYDRVINGGLRNERQKVDEKILGAVHQFCKLQRLIPDHLDEARNELERIGTATSELEATEILGNITTILLGEELGHMSLNH